MIAISSGLLNVALVPTPSAEPAVPFPASVETSPAGVILRIRLLKKSDTYTFPVESRVTYRAPPKLALSPVPSANALLPLPAKTETTPAVETLSILFPPWLATYRFPVESSAIP